MSCFKSCLTYIPPLFILSVIIFVYYSYTIEFCLNFLENRTKKFTYIIILHIFLIFFLWSFSVCLFQDPGSVPNEYKLTPTHHNHLITYDNSKRNEILLKLIEMRQLEIHTRAEDGNIRYCNICMAIKPDRAHHCSSCETCVLKMDHHCPWIRNCVGYETQKQFILMLIYAVTISGFIAATLFEYISQLWFSIYIRTELLILAGVITSSIVGLALGALLIYNLVQIMDNQTTLEALRKPVFVDETKTYDMGKSNNFFQVFGDNCCVCWLPITTALGNGYEFPMRNT